MEYEIIDLRKTVYRKYNGKWRILHVACVHCGKLLKENHIEKCEVLNKREEFMPIRKTEKGYYWGSKGPFPTKQKAEEVQRAAYSAGYREKKDKPTKDSNK